MIVLLAAKRLPVFGISANTFERQLDCLEVGGAEKDVAKDQVGP